MNQLITPTKRIYIEGELNDNIIIEDKLCNYIKNVLRLNKDEYIYILNNKNIGIFQIAEIKKGKIRCKKQSERALQGITYRLTLYQAILKREYMDNIVEKSGELGITKFVPVYTARCQSNINKNTMRRFKDLIIKGVLQSELEYIPEIADPINLEDIVVENKQNFIFYEKCTEKSLPKIKAKDISLFIGPEGGLEKFEIDFLKEKGFQIISPTSSILKAETAAIVFIGIIKILMELS